jgi:nucleotide-binding universal stress UspA family protein
VWGRAAGAGRNADREVHPMSYPGILVLLDHDPQCAARTQQAIRLAHVCGSHLTGLVPTGLVDLPALPAAAASLSELAEATWAVLRDQAGRLADQFGSACRTAGLSSFQAVVDEADKAQSMVRHAHCHDLVVLSQVDPSLDDHRARSAILEATLLHGARPTLVLPRAGRIDTVGTRVLAAWDGRREAARALADALPLLRRAGEVRVVGWTESASADPAATRDGLAAACGWLRRHRIDARPHLESAAGPVGEALLSRAADWGSDLIVMGGYGHARWIERMLGGTTRGLLRSMTVPVLMSH